ncbi:S24/S26 family peptidase [Nesterenkonia pannonica]|uniref:S24/S26 family peptidase n=1 Tax=Nesterenkonia pannonica TaxID=1548602 RepID=UPI002164A96A|nr:S24/S26 family peptidase [Nesterenkonia pannonica]
MSGARQARAALSGLIGLAVVLLVALALSAQLDLVQLRAVQSSSMEPELSVGDLLLNRTVDASEAHEGEIATITHPDGHLVTHRVISNEPGPSGERLIEMQGTTTPLPTR